MKNPNLFVRLWRFLRNPKSAPLGHYSVDQLVERANGAAVDNSAASALLRFEIKRGQKASLLVLSPMAYLVMIKKCERECVIHDPRYAGQGNKFNDVPFVQSYDTSRPGIWCDALGADEARPWLERRQIAKEELLMCADCATPGTSAWSVMKCPDGVFRCIICEAFRPLSARKERE